MAVALGLFLATLATLAPPVSAVHITQPVHAPGTVSVTLHFDEPDDIPLTDVLLHFACDATGAPGFTDSHPLVDGHSSAYATLHISADDSNATQGYGYFQARQTGYGYHAGQHGYETGDTSVVSDPGYGYGYGYTSGDLVLLIDLHPGAFERNEWCTLVVGIDAPGLYGDFESEPSEPFQPRIPPVADADPSPRNVINVTENVAVTLDGSQSNDTDGKPEPLAYDWLQEAGGPRVDLNPGDQPWLVDFTTPSSSQNETLVFNLTVDDGLDTDFSLVTINVHHDNTAPTAVALATPAEAPEGATVTLDGSASFDLEEDLLHYNWTQIDGPDVGLDPEADDAALEFTVPQLDDSGDQDAHFRLNVTDGALFGLDEVTVHFQKAPIAILEAPQLTGRAPHTVLFSVNATCFTATCTPSLDFDDGQQTTAITPGATQTIAHQYTDVGDYTPVLSVIDGRDLANDSAVLVHVLPAGTPYADAGPDQSVAEGDRVKLDGRASYDPDGANLTAYSWQQVDTGHPVTLLGNTSARPTFTAPTVNADATLTFRLTVTDKEGLRNSDEVDVVVRDAASGLYETYYLHDPGCVAEGQDVGAGGPEDHEAHASHTPDGDGAPTLVDDDKNPEADHVCPQTADATVPTVPSTDASAPVDPTSFVDGQDQFPSDDATNNSYEEGSRVDGQVGLAFLLPSNLDPVPTGATLDVVLFDGAGQRLGAQEGIDIDYEDVAFGVVTTLADDGAIGAHYEDVAFHFTLEDGSLPKGAGLKLALQVHADPLLNVFLQDGHRSSFTLTQGAQTNNAPTARISGLTTVQSGDEVHLLGEALDAAADLDHTDFQWYQVGGPHVDLDGARSEEMSFDAPDVDENTTYRFALQVTTGLGASQRTSAPSDVSVHVIALPGGGPAEDNNTEPAVYAGPDLTVDEGASVLLNGVAVDPDQDALTVSWTQVRATGDPSIALTPRPGSDASLTAPQVNGDRQFTFRLTATDPDGATASDTMVLTVRDRTGSNTGNGGNNGNPGGNNGNPGGNTGNPDGNTGNGNNGSPNGNTGNPNGNPGNNGSPNGNTGNPNGVPSGSSGSAGFPPPAGGVLGYDLSASLRVTRTGSVNHLEWASPGFEPLGYQVWSSNSPYVLLALNDGNRTAYDDATGTPDTLYKVTYFTGMTEGQGFFGDAAKVFDWPEAQHHAASKSSHIPGLDAGLVALGLLGAALAIAVRRR